MPVDAVAALMQQLPGDPPTPIAIFPFNHGDQFFTDEQQARLQDLQARQGTLTPHEERELDGLIKTALLATIERIRTLPHIEPISQMVECLYV